MSRAVCLGALVVLVGGFLAGHCLAAPQTFTWTGGGLDNNWSTSRNWLTTETPPPNDGTPNIVFGGRRRLAPLVDAPWSIRSLTFNSTADLFTIGGSALTIDSGGITNSSANVQTINSAIALGADQ